MEAALGLRAFATSEEEEDLKSIMQAMTRSMLHPLPPVVVPILSARLCAVIAPGKLLLLLLPHQ